MIDPFPTFNPPLNVDVAVREDAVKFSPTISPLTDSFAYGDVVPIPTLPLLFTINDVPVDEHHLLFTINDVPVDEPMTN